MKNRRKNMRIIIISAAVAMFAIAGVLTWLLVSTIPTIHIPSKPSDQQMIRNFQNHRPQYEQLLQMIQTDAGLDRVGTLAGNSPENPATVGVDEARLQEYAWTLTQLHVQSLERWGAPRGFEFITCGWGLAVSGWEMGYFYSEQPPSPLVSDTGQSDAPSGYSYHHIEGNWYIYYYSF